MPWGPAETSSSGEPRSATSSKLPRGAHLAHGLRPPAPVPIPCPFIRYPCRSRSHRCRGAAVTPGNWPVARIPTAFAFPRHFVHGQIIIVSITGDGSHPEFTEQGSCPRRYPHRQGPHPRPQRRLPRPMFGLQLSSSHPTNPTGCSFGSHLSPSCRRRPSVNGNIVPYLTGCSAAISR